MKRKREREETTQSENEELNSGESGEDVNEEECNKLTLVRKVTKGVRVKNDHERKKLIRSGGVAPSVRTATRITKPFEKLSYDLYSFEENGNFTLDPHFPEEELFNQIHMQAFTTLTEAVVQEINPKNRVKYYNTIRPSALTALSILIQEITFSIFDNEIKDLSTITPPKPHELELPTTVGDLPPKPQKIRSSLIFRRPKIQNHYNFQPTLFARPRSSNKKRKLTANTNTTTDKNNTNTNKTIIDDSHSNSPSMENSSNNTNNNNNNITDLLTTTTNNNHHPIYEDDEDEDEVRLKDGKILGDLSNHRLRLLARQQYHLRVPNDLKGEGRKEIEKTIKMIDEGRLEQMTLLQKLENPLIVWRLEDVKKELENIKETVKNTQEGKELKVRIWKYTKERMIAAMIQYLKTGKEEVLAGTKRGRMSRKESEREAERENQEQQRIRTKTLKQPSNTTTATATATTTTAGEPRKPEDKEKIEKETTKIAQENYDEWIQSQLEEL